MTKHFTDEDGRRWKAWLASRDVFWPDPDMPEPESGFESVLFVCFSDPSQPQKRLKLPAGSFEDLEGEELRAGFVRAAADPAIR